MKKYENSLQIESEVKKKTDNRWPKFFFRALLYLSMILFIVIVGAILSLQTRPVRDTITRIIEKTIAQNTRSVCRIDDLSGNLISRFELKGVELKDAATGAPLMSAGRIQVSYSIPMLLGRVLWINRLMIDRVSLELIQAKDGTWNFERLASENSFEPLSDKSSESKASSGFKVEIRRLILQDADITLSQQTDSGTTTRHFEGINCRARLDIGNEIFAKIKHLAARLDTPHVDLTDLSGEIRYNAPDNYVNFTNTRINGEKSDFTINGLLRFPENGPDSVNMDLRADIKAMSLGEFGRTFSIQMPDEDIVSGNISVSGPVSKMDCQADLRMEACHSVLQGLVAIDDSNNVSLDIAGKINGLDLSALPALDLEFFPGNLNTDFSLVWQQIGMPDQIGRINLDLASSRLWDYLIDRAELDVRIAGADFIFENLQFKTFDGDLDGSGRFDGIMSGETDNRIQFTADFKGVHPEKFVKNPRYSGSLNGSVSSAIFIPKTFALEEMTGEATCQIGNSRIMDMDILSAELEASWRDEKIIVNRFDMETGFGTASAKGYGSIKDRTCRFNAAATLPDLKLIKPVMADMADDERLSGSLLITADINGSWEAPDVKAVINGEKIVFQDVSADSFSADGQWKGNSRDFNVSAECGVKNIRIRELQIPVLDLKTTLTPVSFQTDIDFQGEQNAHLMLSGKLNHWLAPEKEFFIEKVLLVLPDQPSLVNRKPVKLTLSGERINIDALHLDSGDATIELQGHAELIPPADVSASLILRDFDLKRIAGFWDGGEKIRGRLFSEVQLSGLLDNPVIDGHVSIKDGLFDKFSVSKAAASIVYLDSKAMVTASADQQNKRFLDVKGSVLMAVSLYPFSFVPKHEGLELMLDVNQVDISWISDLIDHPEYGISGILNGSAAVSGNFPAPRFQGRMQLIDGTLELKKQMLTYETLTADIRFEKNSITIDSIDIRGDKEGVLHLSGVLTHDKFRPQTFNIRAVGDQLYIPFHSGVDAWINPDIFLSGAWEAPVLSGEIRVPEGRVNLERFFEKKLSDIQIVASAAAENGVLRIPEKEPAPLEFVDPLTADVTVIIPSNFWFKGKDEFIEIKGDVQLKKDPQKPFVLYGSVFPVRGTYRFQGRLFQIKQGELAFAGQEDINPSLNIEAFTLIGDVKIIIRLTGTFEQLNLVLDSEPAMDQSAIISYLVFGRAPNDLSEKETFQAEEAALSFTGQIAADKLRDIVGETLGIDYLNISAGSGGLRQGSLTMGKYVLPRVFVTFRQGFDETVTQKLEVTYEINKNFDLETQIDNEQTSAVDLIWKYEF